MKKILWFTLLLCLLPVWAFGATYTVCASGCDETAIQDVFDNNDLAPGDIVEVRADSPGGSKYYREFVTWGSNDGGASGNNVILRGRSGDTVTITGANVITTWSDEGSNVWSSTLATEPFTVAFDDTPGDVELGACPGALNADQEWCWSSNVLYQYSTSDPDTRYTNPGTEAAYRAKIIYSADVDYITISNLICSSPNDAKAIDLRYGTGMAIDSVTVKNLECNGIDIVGSAPGVSITNCTVTSMGYGAYDYEFSGIAVYALADDGEFSGMTLSGNTISGCNGMGISIYGHDTSNRMSNVVIANNDSSGNGTGIYLQYVDGATVYGNTFNNNTVALYSSVENYGIGVMTGSNITTYGNIISNNGVDGIEFWGGTGGTPEKGVSDDNIVERNLIYGNGDDGVSILTDYVSGTLVRFNIIYGNGENGFKDNGGGTGKVFSNNIVYNNTYDEIRCVSCTGLTIKNNIAYAINNEALEDFADDGTLDAHLNNCYYKASGTVVSWDSVDYALAQVTTFEASAVAADPKLNTNYTLSPASPCKYAGTDPFSDGDGDQYDATSPTPLKIWDDATNATVGPWGYGITLGAFGYQPGKVLLGSL